MAEVRQALEEFEAALAARGLDLRANLRPGDDPDDVAARCRAAGLEPTDDVVDWFGFVGGATRAEPGEVRLGGLFDDLWLTSLERSLALRDERLAGDAGMADAELADAIAFEATWLPISEGKPIAFVDLGPGPERGALRAVWNDEPWVGPRLLASDLARWVRGLIPRIEADVFEYTATGLVLLEQAYFPVGSVTMTSSSANRLASIRDRSTIPALDRLVLGHPGPGALPANGGREPEQAAAVERALRQNGFDGWAIDRQATDDPGSNPELSTIVVYGGIRPERR